jgi:hypothetical protein
LIVIKEAHDCTAHNRRNVQAPTQGVPMATTKKPVAPATEKDAKPVKAAVLPKPQPAAVAEAAPKADAVKAPAAKKVAAKAAPVKTVAAKKVPVKKAAVAAVPKAVVAPAAAPAPLAAKAAPQAKAPAKSKPAAKVWREIDPTQRANYIEVAAFYIAERRGFAPGNPEQDYLEAAAEIDRMIAAGHFAK